ncbi:hypothetical protein FGG08_005092 [Glutinoglossum americanum]|uniref:Uncharacterized protein n=1 Tax=Glutinoglossum americanum TaxID=1670608 RepID=A0A9P8KYV9_9PEZI|nr:hypothetical protein FGG08_005092 [Glutinoglossum americanum]
MSLAELNTSHVADGGIRVNSGSPRGGSVASQGSTSTTPSSSHDALEVTAEAKGVGSLSVKQSRLPYPIVRISPRKYKSTLGPAQITDASNVLSTPGSDPYATVHVAVTAPREKNISTASSIISMYGRDSPSNSRSVFRQTSEREYRSFSMTQSSHTSYTLSNHRSYSSLRDPRVPGIPARPRSPFAYPTRLKRPGFRPSSPISIDARGSDSRNTAGIDQSSSFRASEPPSYLARRSPGYGVDQDRPELPPLLTPTPSVHSCQHSRGTPPPSGTTTPTLPLMSSTGLFSVQAGGSGTQSLGRPMCRGNDQLSPPLYYDYTEAFEDEDFSLHRQNSSFPLFAIDKSIPEDCPVTNGFSAGENIKEATEQPANTGGGGHQYERDELSGYSRGDIGNPITPNSPTTDQFKEDSRDHFHTKNYRGLEGGVLLDPIATTSEIDAKASLEYTLIRPSYVYPFCDPNRDGGDLCASAIPPPTQPAISHYQSLRIQEDTEIYTRLRARRRDLYSSTPREIGMEDACNQKLADKRGAEEDTVQAVNLEGGGAVLERPISSYSRRSSIRRFFSSDQGFLDLPDIVTSFEGIGKPYTPDRFLLGGAGSQYNYTKKGSNNRIRRIDSATDSSFDLRHSGSTAGDGDIRRSASKLTKRSPKEREPEIFAIVGDISGVDGIPQTHPVLCDKSKRKRRLSSAQEDFHAAIPGLSHPDLMKQLPQLPVPRSPELISFPLPPSAIPLQPPRSGALPSTGSVTQTAERERNPVPPCGGGTDDITSNLARPGMPLEISHSALSLFPSSGRVVALGELETYYTATRDLQGVDPAHKVAAPQKFKVRTRLPMAARGVWKPSSRPDTEIGFQASSSVDEPTSKVPFDVIEKMKKVSFQDTRQSQLDEHPPKFKLRSSAVSASRTYNLEEPMPRNEAPAGGSDRNGPHRLGVLIGGRMALGGRIFGRETGEMAPSGRLSTSSDKVARGRSSNVGSSPYLRHANPSEPRSVFSDDSSQIVSNRNAMKRLTNLRAKLPTLNASRRSRDGQGSFDKAVTNLAVVRSRKDGIETSLKTVDTCKVQYEVKKLASRFGSWFHRRRERSRVVFRSFRRGRKARTSVARTGMLYPGV